MPSALGIRATEQLGIKTIDEDRTETDTNTKQAQKSSRTNCTHSQIHIAYTHHCLLLPIKNFQYSNITENTTSVLTAISR